MTLTPAWPEHLPGEDNSLLRVQLKPEDPLPMPIVPGWVMTGNEIEDGWRYVTFEPIEQVERRASEPHD